MRDKVSHETIERKPQLKPSSQVEINSPLFRETLVAGIKETGVTLTPQNLDNLDRYYVELVQTNQVMNLTGITEAAQVAEKHMLDSLMLRAYLKPGDRVVDIGTGAGFPGLPLAICADDAGFLLLDSLQKRCGFLERVVGELELSNTEIKWARAEEVGTDPAYRGQFQVAVARAVAPLPILLEYAIPLLQVGGKFLAMKSQKTHEEVASSENALKTLGCKVIEIKEYVFSGGEKRTIIIVEKNQATAAKYPRNAGAMKKNPL